MGVLWKVFKQSHRHTLELCGVTKNHPFCFMKQEINFTLITKQQEDKTHIFHHTHTHTHTCMITLPKGNGR